MTESRFFYVASRIACKAFHLCSFKRAFLYLWLLFLFPYLFEQPTQGQWSSCACFYTSFSSNYAFSYSVKRTHKHITCAHTHWHPHTHPPTHSLGAFDSKCRQLKAVRATLSLSVSSLFFLFSSSFFYPPHSCLSGLLLNHPSPGKSPLHICILSSIFSAGD